MFVNRRQLEFTGQTLQEVIANGWADAIHPEYRQTVREVFAQSFEERIPFTTECPMLRSDGENNCWMRGHVTPRFLEKGAFMGYLG